MSPMTDQDSSASSHSILISGQNSLVFSVWFTSQGAYTPIIRCLCPPESVGRIMSDASALPFSLASTCIGEADTLLDIPMTIPQFAMPRVDIPVLSCIRYPFIRLLILLSCGTLDFVSDMTNAVGLRCVIFLHMSFIFIGVPNPLALIAYIDMLLLFDLSVASAWVTTCIARNSQITMYRIYDVVRRLGIA